MTTQKTPITEEQFEEAKKLVAQKEAQLKLEKAQLEFDERAKKARLRCLAEIQEAVKFNNNLVESAKKFYKDFPEGWSLNLSEHETTKEASEYYPVSTEKTESRVVFKRTYKLVRPTITKGDFVVEIVPVYKRAGSYTYREYFDGYGMNISGPEIDWSYSQRAIKRPSTIVKKVKELEEASDYQRTQRIKQKAAQAEFVRKVKEDHPAAKVLEGTSWKHGYGSPNRGYQIHTVDITFPNRTKITVQVYSDGSTRRENIYVPGYKDIYDELNFLESINTPTEEK